MTRSDRLTAHTYFDTALQVLGERGSEALTIAELCERLTVTKGSFYHHFAGLPDFVDQLLAYWEDEHTRRLIAVSQQQADLQQRRALVIDFAVGLPHAPEAALRAWARSNADVATVVARVDRGREKLVMDSLLGEGLSRDNARLFSRLALDALIGQQMRERRLSKTRLRRSLEELSRLVSAEL